MGRPISVALRCWRSLIRLFAVAVIGLPATHAAAGRPCEAHLPQAVNVERSMNLAVAAAHALDASGAQVVVLARIGQDLRQYGLRYSHLGLAYREQVPAPGGALSVWRVAHKLNQCGSARAAVFRQGLGEFVLDDLFDYEVAFAVLDPALQARLLPILKDNDQLARMHTPAYNMLAYPWSRRYQQSNQWAIETLAMAQEPGARDRERAQAWLKLQDYRPTSLHIGGMQRLGARVSTANVAFDDHPNSKRFGDRIETMTVDSVFDWLQTSRLGAPPVVVR